MNIAQFTEKYHLSLDPNTCLACQSGLDIMRRGTDPNHDEEHVFKILDHLGCLLDIYPGIFKYIDFEVLLPAICWHDTWIANHQAKNIPHLLYLQLIEGRMSSKIWRLYANGIFEQAKVQKISYCIRKHSSVQILPTFTLEAKILIDLDKLEIWNAYRFLKSKDTLVSQKKLYSRYLVRFYFQYSWYAGLYFRELNNKLSGLRNSFWSELQ